jgi:hypothetical protein
MIVVLTVLFYFIMTGMTGLPPLDIEQMISGDGSKFSALYLILDQITGNKKKHYVAFLSLLVLLD